MAKTTISPLAKSLPETMKRMAIELPPEAVKRTNPFTGKSHILEPEAAQLYDFITTDQHTCGVDYTRKEWDSARYHFLSRWPDQYYDLID